MLRIIDNKKIDLTNDEYALYQKICRSYDREPGFKGEFLFKGLFQTDDRGKIVFLIPPSGKQFSLEVYLFLINIMVHQQLGDACKEVRDLTSEAKEVLNECKRFLKKNKSIKSK